MLFLHIFQAFALLMGCVYAQEFVITFDVNSPTRSYRSFIEDIRRQARDPSTGSHNLPVLLPQDPVPTRFFDIVLTEGANAVRLRLRRDNLFIVGYRNEHGNQWFELARRDDQRYIDGSTPLGFRGNYDGLQGQGAANQHRRGIALGRAALIRAVQELPNATTGTDRATHLLVLIQMISEATRFTAITDEIVNNYQNGAPPSARTLRFETSWGALSGEVLHTDDDNHYRPRIPTNEDLNLNSFSEILLVLGILLRAHVVNNAGGGSRPRRSTMSDGMEIDKRQNTALILPGRPLVEVYHVVINNIDNENPGDLYGTITATDGLQSYYIYNRERSNYESIYPGGYPTLTGPPRAINAADEWQINFDLKDKDSDASPDDEIANDRISWSNYDYNNVFDKVQSVGVSGKYGNTGIVYAVMSNAAEALIEVNLINGDGENPADVYGTIKSHTSKYADQKIVLFNTAKNDHIDVKPNENIPLLRKAVVVPMDATLTVTADLMDHDADASPDDEIAKGIAEFKPQILQSVKERIKGAYGEVEVRITWL